MLISIIIPAYNAAPFIGEAINSAIRQDITSKEIIVVDDGSTDNTAKIVKSYGSSVNYYYQKNSGAATARNYGISKANGKYVAFLDSDDFWAPSHLSLLLNELTKIPHAGLIYCGKVWINEKGEELDDVHQQSFYPSGWIFRDLFEANYISSSSVVVARKEVIMQEGGFCEASEMRNAQDYELWLRISSKYEILSSQQKTVYYRRHGSNRTKDTVSRFQGLQYALNTACNLLQNDNVNLSNNPSMIDLPERMKKFYKNAVISLLYLGAYSEAKAFCVEAIKRGYCSTPLLLRFPLTFLPKFILNKIKVLKHKHWLNK